MVMYSKRVSVVYLRAVLEWFCVIAVTRIDGSRKVRRTRGNERGMQHHASMTGGTHMTAHITPFCCDVRIGQAVLTVLSKPLSSFLVITMIHNVAHFLTR